MTTQQFMGRHQLVSRLTAQVGSRDEAIALLKKRGHMNAKGELTATGRARDRMTAAERAKDRAARATRRKPADFDYNPATNAATRRR
jgi:hypothetical protein